MQISLADFEPLAAFAEPLQSLGLVYRDDNPDRAKRYFREAPGMRRTHIHVRRAGSFSEQFALLFRDYMQDNDDEARAYARLKYQLAVEHRDARQVYVEAKTPFIWAVMQRADKWSRSGGGCRGRPTLEMAVLKTRLGYVKIFRRWAWLVRVKVVLGAA